MTKAIREINSMQFKFVLAERLTDGIRKGEFEIKIKYNPLNIFINILSPEKNTKVVWKQGENDGKAKIDAKGIPFKVSLDPYGKKIRKGHNTIFELNLNYMSGIVQNILEKVDKESVKNEGEVIFDGKPCYKIVINNSSFRFNPYKAKEGESIHDIAVKNKLSEYMILSKNKDIEGYNTVITGKTISIPNSYASKIILLIDKSTLLPISQTMYDDEGLFENYEFYDVKLNPEFSDKDFKL